MKELNEIKGFWEPREGAVILALETVEGKRDSTWVPVLSTQSGPTCT